MKRALLLIVVPALLVALGFAQTPAASVKTDQTTIKGCLGGSDGNYTVAEDNTGHIFKITTSSVDLKPHLGHDVTLIGHRASGVSSGAAGDSLAVTELNMISEHCAAVAAAPAATVSTPSGTASAPPAAATAPAATVSTLSETAITPAAAATAPAATVSTPSETVSTPAAAATAPAATVSTPAAAAARPTRLSERLRRPPATPAAAAAAAAATVSTASETATTPAAADTTPAAAASTPAPAATTPTATARGGSLWLLISFAVLVIVLATLAPLLSRWRKRKNLERTGAPNLSFTKASPDQGKDDQPPARKVA